MPRFLSYFLPIFDKLCRSEGFLRERYSFGTVYSRIPVMMGMEFYKLVHMAEEEEEIITTNKFKTARNEFRKSRQAIEEDENAIEDIADEENSEDIPKEPIRRKQSSRVDSEKPVQKDSVGEPDDDAPAQKRKRKTPKEKVNPFQPVINFFKDERLHRVAGLALILASIYLLVAFTSFLFTWKTDQDKVMGSWSALFFPNDETPVVSGTSIDNWL